MLFFGGAIPYYAAQRKMNVVVAYMTCGTTMRRSELLNGLWAMGVRNYPVIGEFWDKYSYNLEGGYSAWGKRNTNQYLTGLLRQFKPEVVLTGCAPTRCFTAWNGPPIQRNTPIPPKNGAFGR